MYYKPDTISTCRKLKERTNGLPSFELRGITVANFHLALTVSANFPNLRD